MSDSQRKKSNWLQPFTKGIYSIVLIINFFSSPVLIAQFQSRLVLPTRPNVPLESAVFSSDGKRILIASDKYVQVVEVASGNEVQVFEELGFQPSAIFSQMENRF